MYILQTGREYNFATKNLVIVNTCIAQRSKLTLCEGTILELFDVAAADKRSTGTA